MVETVRVHASARCAWAEPHHPLHYLLLQPWVMEAGTANWGAKAESAPELVQPLCPHLRLPKIYTTHICPVAVQVVVAKSLDGLLAKGVEGQRVLQGSAAPVYEVKFGLFVAGRWGHPGNQDPVGFRHLNLLVS